ncbi:ABC transporter ATP-binding protein [uncultured Marinobacter sp.]|uniref:ABC transporter ATP-binding protein n=1 Tax=uncultured Marinobacter sp. TaxID=187379 RepID=UPI0025843348|nr:ABC transporter ATP-binding protein [uncultured Marinobacter sp.]
MSPAQTATLAADSITLAHRQFTVAENLSVTLPTGKVTAIVGPNGCGKSTLLNGLARIHAPAKGSVLLDEPTSALDLGHQIEVFELIRTLSGQGKTIAMVVHDLASACRYADHMVAMKAGKIIEEGTPAEIVSPELVQDLYGVSCDLIQDPATGSPLLVNVRRNSNFSAA